MNTPRLPERMQRQHQRAHTFRAKKGPGSYRRKAKHPAR